ncbi:arylsulfotransferase family protein [Natrinema soli]|uniref:Arylsulfotransferase family protein n=1 Tax=Natrinema soli TaxID=1930624 RepID=A0ABD5SJG3_9EURY|nr:arylsulfotransferase family protein [Natrinema soli]
MELVSKLAEYRQVLSKKRLRVCFTIIILFASLFLIGANNASSREPYMQFQTQADLPREEQTPVADSRSGITVVTSHEQGNIIALRPDGTNLYYNDSHDGYWDVDPSPKGEKTVMYPATDEVHDTSVCKPVKGDTCIRQMIERVNLTTGETTTLYSRIDPQYHNSEWHDVDRINESHYIVADMYSDEVFIVDVNNGIVEWEWSLQNHFSLKTGGDYSEDWAHLNDVEVLEDGRIMLSPRNHDQVLFLEPGEGVIDNWTIGKDGEHSTLYEQHNPDYIPESDGGPAVAIADSENNRIVEYHRSSGGDWEQAWEWQDSRIQWPRDADRLPNGNTLITDTHGNRVLEINQQGDIVWDFDFTAGYEAERLGTGDESEGGPSAQEAGLPSRTSNGDTSISSEESATQINNGIKGLLPNKIVNGLANATPSWLGFLDLIVLSAGMLTAVFWGGLELWWAPWTIQRPVVRK